MSPRPAGSGWPGPRRPLVAIKLEAELVERIDELATATGVSRSAWLRGAIDLALDNPNAIKPRR